MKITFRHIILFFGILFVLVLVVVSKKEDINSKNMLSTNAISSLSVLIPEEISFDFGTVSMKNGTVQHQFRITNEGNDPVVVKKVYTSCMCTAASVTDGAGKVFGPFGMPGHAGPQESNIVIRSRETVVVEAIFDPAAHGPSGVGLAQRAVYLETNSSQSPKIEFSFQAVVVR